MVWALLVEGCIIYLLGGYSTQFRVGNFGQEFHSHDSPWLCDGGRGRYIDGYAEHTTTNDACKSQGLHNHFAASALALSPD